jgi:hypothetical protein
MDVYLPAVHPREECCWIVASMERSEGHLIAEQRAREMALARANRRARLEG